MDRSADSRLSEVFSSLNLSDFPVLKEHSRAINQLVASPNSTIKEMVDVCQHDYGLTVKFLREANAAFYMNTRPISTVSGAAGRIGQATIKELIGNMPVLEDVAKMVGEKEIIPLVAKSFLSGCLARSICAFRKFSFTGEEAFVCGLLHNMGKVAGIIFLPEMYRRVVDLTRNGISESEAAAKVNYGFSYHQLGMELGRFWGFPERLIASMEEDPLLPRGTNDQEGILQNLASFSSKLVEAVCEGGPTNVLLDHFGKALGLDKEQALKLLLDCLEETKQSGKTYRQCMLGYKVTGKIRRLESLLSGSIRSQSTIGMNKSPGTKIQRESEQGQADPVKQFFDKINHALKKRVRFNEFAPIVLDALTKGIGLDRVLIASLEIGPDTMYLQGRFGAGDILSEEVRAFRYPLVESGDLFADCLAQRKDLSLSVDWETAMLPVIKEMYFGRLLYVFLLYLNDAPVGLLLLDRQSGRLPLTESQFNAVSSFRDLLLMGIRKDMDGFIGDK